MGDGPADRTSRRWPLRWQPTGAWWPRIAIGVGIGSTIAMNVYGGLWDGGPGGAVVAALYPVALVVSLETLIWVIRNYGQKWTPAGEHLGLWFGAALLASLAAITGLVSYLHALTVLQRTGSGHLGWPAIHLSPLVPDQMILTGTVALVIAARRGLARKERKEHQAGNADQQARTTKTRTAKTRTTAEPKLSARAKAAITRTAELNRIVNLVRSLDTVPGERALAADYCGGNRRLARDVLAELDRSSITAEGDR